MNTFKHDFQCHTEAKLVYLSNTISGSAKHIVYEHEHCRRYQKIANLHHETMRLALLRGVVTNGHRIQHQNYALQVNEYI